MKMREKTRNLQKSLSAVGKKISCFHDNENNRDNCDKRSVLTQRMPYVKEKTVSGYERKRASEIRKRQYDYFDNRIIIGAPAKTCSAAPRLMLLPLQGVLL